MPKAPDPTPFSSRLPSYQERLESYLESFLPPADATPGRLHEAIRYATLGGGKRIRPLLLYASGEVCRVHADELDPAAAALEAIHTYSLVHDDLPDMDDDDLRRGKPAVHLAYDPATAILVGDALQSWAFGQLAKAAPAVSRAWLRLLADAAGSLGMCGGQCLDIEGEVRSLALEDLQKMYRRKTGALISASVMMATNCREDLNPEICGALQLYAEKLGLAFQIQDDILDVEASSQQLGKPQGSDARQGKSTFVSLLGLDEARLQADQAYRQACNALDRLGDRAEPLIYLASYLVNRTH